MFAKRPSPTIKEHAHRFKFTLLHSKIWWTEHSTLAWSECCKLYLVDMYVILTLMYFCIDALVATRNPF
jgi:hypothetical protein